MATARDIMKGGVSSQTARALGGQYSTVAAAGSVIGDATAITTSMCIVTAADGTKGVSISGDVGDECWVTNRSASALLIYPEAAAAIAVSGTGLGTAAVALSVAAEKSVILKKYTSTQWVANLSS